MAVETISDIQATVETYMEGVLSGAIPACKWTKLAVKRQQKDLKRAETKAFPYEFDQTRAEHPIEFIHNFCVHVKGDLDRKPLILEPWEQFIVWVLFGWVDKESRFRRYNIAFIEVAKKNGKSTLVAAIGLYMTVFDGEGGAEVYSAATTRDQAKIVFHNYARAMVIKSPELKKAFKPYAASIVDVESETSFFKPLSSDHDTLDGKSVHCAIIDEYHAHKNDGVYKVMTDGMAGRKQALSIVITTAGFDPDVPCVDEEDYAKRVLGGKAKNETYFAIIYTIDEKDDWKDKKVWPKANPCYGVSVDIKRFIADFDKAMEMPTEQSKFKNKRLNVWTKNKETWIKDEDWEKIERVFDLAELAGKECYGAIDLASSIDTASYTLTWPTETSFKQYTRIFVPDFELKEREDRERFEWQQMADEGHVTLTAGRVIDYDYIQAELEKDLDEYDIREIGYDPWNASQFISNLIKIGLEDKLVEISQGWRFISPAMKDFETKVINKKERQIEPYRNPVLAWMVSNCMKQSDARGNTRPIKSSSKKHIDGVVSSIMSLDRAVRNVNGGSVYETRGPLVLNI